MKKGKSSIKLYCTLSYILRDNVYVAIININKDMKEEAELMYLGVSG